MNYPHNTENFDPEKSAREDEVQVSDLVDVDPAELR